MKKHRLEQREHQRVRIAMSASPSVAIRVATYVPSGNHIHCTVSDVSKSGMCIYTDRPLSRDMDIEVDWIIPRAGTVRWCEEISTNLYRAGIHFS